MTPRTPPMHRRTNPATGVLPEETQPRDYPTADSEGGGCSRIAGKVYTRSVPNLLKIRRRFSCDVVILGQPIRRAMPERPAAALESALLQAQAGGDRSQAGFMPPHAVKKEIPEMKTGLDPAMPSPHGDRLRHSRPILAALNHWSFPPAQLDGKTVALKVLIGLAAAHSIHNPNFVCHQTS